MGRIGMATRDELVGALTVRYTASDRRERGRILDEFVAVSGLHRKHAMRLLRAGQANQRSGPRRARRLYSEAVREALIGTVGSIGPRLRQTAAGTGADTGRSDGTARPS